MYMLFLVIFYTIFWNILLYCCAFREIYALRNLSLYAEGRINLRWQAQWISSQQIPQK